jgi:Ca2+-binding RTX toxin-like protein
MQGSSTAERGSGRGRKFISTIVSVAMAASVGVIATPEQVRAASPEEQAISDGLEEVMAALAGLDDLDELAQALPLSDLLPTGADGLDLVEALSDVIADLDDAFASGELEQHLDGLSGPVGGGVVADVDASVSGQTVTFETLALQRAISAPLVFQEAGVDLAGGTLTGNLRLDLSGLVVDLDTTATPELFIPLPTATGHVTADLAVDFGPTGVDIRLGILDVHVTGSGAAAVDFSVDLLDPDGNGRLDLTELTTSAPLDLFNVQYASSSASLDAALSVATGSLLDTPLLAPSLTGSIHYVDTDLSDGFVEGVDTLDFDAPELPNFAEMGPEQILVAIAQLAVALQSMQTRVGNTGVPLLGSVAGQDTSVENLADLIDVNEQIGQFFIDQGLSTPESPFELKIGDVDGDGVPDVDLETLGLDTIDGIIATLATYLGDAADLDYDPPTNGLTFDLAFSDTYTPPPAEVKINDQLAALGLRGVVSSPGAGISLAADYAVDVTFGVDLTDFSLDDPITDRLFIETDGVEVSGNAAVNGDLDLGGTIGFLEVALADTDADAGADGYVPLLAKRDGDTDPMLQLDLVGGTDGRVTLSDLYSSLGSLDADLVDNVFTVDAADFDVVGTINAAVPPTTLEASATVGSTDIASASFTFGWPDILDAEPQFTGDYSAFTDNFSSFDFDTENPLALFNQIVDAIDTGLAALDNLGASGDPQNPGVLDEELPLIGASPRDAVAFIGDVRDAVNEVAQDPSGSLQKLEIQLEVAIAEALGIDLSTLGEMPDANDAAFILDSGTPGDPSDDVFDTAGFQLAIDQYLADLQSFLAGNDFVDLQWVAGNSPGDIIITLNLGVCSDKSDQVGHPGCTHEIPLESSFNFDTSDLGDFAGIVAAEGGGTVALDYNAAVTLGIGVELPDVSAGEVPKPFITDDSGIDLRVAGMFDGSFGATIGPFEISVGSTNTPAEDCANDLDDDGDGFVNDGCPPVGETSETDAQCANATDDDATDDDESDGATDGTPSLVNDGCPGVSTEMSAKAGAMAQLKGTVADGRAYLFPEAGEPGLPELLGSIDFANAFQPNPLVDCGSGAMIACGRLPLFVNTGGPTDTPLGAASLQIDGDFNVTFGPPDFFDQVLANLETAGADLLWALVGTGLIEFGEFIDESTSAAAYDVEVPVVGDILDGGAEIAGAFNDGIATPLGTFFQSFDPTDLTQLTTGLETGIFDAINAAGAADLLEDRDGSGGPNAGDIEVTAFCGNAECTAADTLLEVTDTRVELGLGEVIAAADPIPFDFGVPGLRLATQDGDDDGVADGVEAAVTWSIDVGFGLSEAEGFYLYTGNAGDPEISVDVTVDVPDLSADIAFLGVEVDGDAAKPQGRNQAEELVLGLAIDLPAVVDGKLPLSQLGNVDPSELLPTLTANVDLWWPILTAPEFGGSSAGDGTLPTVHAVLDLTWNASLGVDGFDFGDLNLGFQQVQLDLGSFVSDFLEPVLGEVQTFTKPLQPIIDTVTAPIPGVSQLAELVGADPVTMLDLFEAISENDLTLIRTLLDVITFVNAIAGLGNSADGILIDIGSFQVSGEKLGEAELPANQKDTLITSETLQTGSIVDAINSELDAAFASVFTDNLADGEEFSDDEPGFTFPAFEDLSSIFDLLVGKDVTLIRFASGPLKAEFGWSQSFGPIAVGPVPVSIVISGSASIQGRFAVGYDTKGVRQLVQAITADDGPDVTFLQGFGFLFNGLFLDDLNAAGQDVPEIRLVVEFAAGAAVDLVVVSAGVEGGVRATLDLNLHDGGFFEPIPPENLDGKLRLDEIASFLFNNPICLFDVSGKLEAFIRIFVEIDLFLFSARFEFTVVNITLLELKNITAELCQPPEPVLAKKFGSTLVLHTGPNATHRNFAEDEPAEKYTVRAVDTDGDDVADAVKVTAFGFEETHAGITKVVGDFGTPGETTDDKDQVRFDAGSNESVDGAGNVVTTAVPFTIATEVCGGPGDDKFYGGDGTDVLVGDGAWNGTYGEGFACTTGDAGTDGADELTGNGDIDTLWGNGNNDVLSGGSGGDTINAGPGADQANGDIGGDTIDGGDGDDTLRGGADVDPTGDADTETDGFQAWPAGVSDDVIAGGPGIDTIDGDFGDDTITGGTENDTVVGGFGDDTISGDEGEDTIFGNDGDDPMLSGGPGDDVILGMLGDDTIRGGPGHDNLIGNDGDDDIDGEEGLDIVLGDNGSINRAPLQADLLPTDPSLPLVTLEASSGGAGDTDLAGGPDDDVIHGQEGADTMRGGGGDDEMYGAAGIDTMSGDAGADTMFGDNDADVMYGDDATGSNGCADLDDDIRGGSGDDVIEGNADADRIFGDSGDDVVYGDAESPGSCDLGDVIRGNGDDDRVWGNADADVVNGDGGDDRLVGGGRHADEPDGGDLVRGDAGDDVIAGDNAEIADGGGTPATFAVTIFLDEEGAGDALFGDGGTDRIFGQHGGDAISGGADQDFLEGNADIDVIDGDGGDDRISGGSSTRATIRSDGDTVTVPYDTAPDAGDVINGGAGDDVIAGDNAEIAADGTTQMTASNGFGVFGADVVHGNDGDDRIYGQLGGDILYGDDGADHVLGDLGFIAAEPDADLPRWPGGAPNYGVDLDAPDPERVGNGDPTGGADEIRGGGDDDHLFGGVGDDLIEGNADDDYMEGNNGDDSMFGNALGLELGDDEDDMIGGSSSATRDDDVRLDGGENLMQGNGDHDVMIGDNGDIERVVDPSDDTAWAADEVIPGARKRIVTLLDRDKAVLDAVSGPDHLQGNAGSDRMHGEGDADLVQGNDGDDLIEGNQGADWLEGNAGEDDIIGGSSLLASAGGLPDGDPGDDPADLGDPDVGDAIFGGAGADVIAGDNAVVVRKTDANSAAYDAALASAYHTTDPDDAVPGWWLGVSTHRLVTLLDRSAAITGRYGVDIVHAGSGDDVAFGQDGSDWMSGGADDDALEGNGGNDDIYGDRAPEDSETVVPLYLSGDRDWVTLGLVSTGAERDGAPDPAGEDDIVGGSNEAHRDGDDTVRGDGEDDFVLGDNGTLRRWIDATGTAYRGHTGDGARERVFRIADQLTPATPADQHGDDALDGNDGDDAIWGQDGADLIRGQAGDDDLLGELGHDTIYGGTGEDAMVGDRGSILNTALGEPDALFVEAPSVGDYSGPPFLTGVAYFVSDRFDRRVDLQLDIAGSVGGPFPGTSGPPAALDQPGITTGGNDVLRGGPGHDSMHGAWGDDLMNGDEGGDWLFGSHGSDVMWGGFGDAAGSPDLGDGFVHVDRLFGGRGGDPANDAGVVTGGADLLDYKPRTMADGGYDDPQAWHDAVAPYDDGDGGGAAEPQHHQGTDWIYGGWDRDVMQGNVTEPGPNAGDRMWDWTGAFNLYTHCDPDYGGYNDQRTRSPQMEQFLELLAYDSGIGSSLADVRNPSSSAYRELALVYKTDTKDNNGKSYPTTPGHFDEIAGCDEEPDVP